MLKPAGIFLQVTLLPPPPPSQLRARASHSRANVGMFRVDDDSGVGTCVVDRGVGTCVVEGLSMLHQIMKAKLSSIEVGAFRFEFPPGG